MSKLCLNGSSANVITLKAFAKTSEERDLTLRRAKISPNPMFCFFFRGKKKKNKNKNNIQKKNCFIKRKLLGKSGVRVMERPQ